MHARLDHVLQSGWLRTADSTSAGVTCGLLGHGQHLVTGALDRATLVPFDVSGICTDHCLIGTQRDAIMVRLQLWCRPPQKMYISQRATKTLTSSRRVSYSSIPYPMTEK